MGGERKDVNKERLELALEAAGLDLWENDLVTGGITCHARKIFAELGYSESEALPYVKDLLALIHPDDVERVQSAIEAHLSRRTDRYRSEFRVRSRSGEWVWYANYGKIMDHGSGEFQGRRFIGVTFNIDDRKRQEQALEQANRRLLEQNRQLEAMNERLQSMATSDPLTQLPNRRFLLDRLQKVLGSRMRSHQAGALLFIDIDNFKNLNDTLGHDMGDLLLQKVARRLGACIREADTVARIGGDEFVVLLEGLSMDPIESADQVETVGQKILNSLNQPYHLGAREYRISPSIGVSLFNGGMHTVAELMRKADIAMYRAKQEGRNTMRFFDPQMQEDINLRVEIEAGLRRALEEGQFRLYFQVQVDSAYRLLGAEALIRWQHPELGLLSPSRFLHVAEETGLIVPLGNWVLESACSRLREWQSHGDTCDLSLSVNVSASQFREPGFVERVTSTVHAYGVDPRKLKMELTESILLEDVQKAALAMNALRDVGIQFSLDDFGTGYSSLQYLKQLPFHQIKIDRSFIRDIVTDPGDRAIIRTIVAMARSLDAHVMAEGVETREQRQLLLTHGCTRYQGDLFGQAMPLEDFRVGVSQKKTGQKVF